MISYPSRLTHRPARSPRHSLRWKLAVVSSSPTTTLEWPVVWGLRTIRLASFKLGNHHERKSSGLEKCDSRWRMEGRMRLFRPRLLRVRSTKWELLLPEGFVVSWSFVYKSNSRSEGKTRYGKRDGEEERWCCSHSPGTREGFGFRWNPNGLLGCSFTTSTALRNKLISTEIPSSLAISSTGTASYRYHLPTPTTLMLSSQL